MLPPAKPRRVSEVAPGIFAVPVRGAQAFLVVGDGLTLIDTGSRGSAPQILAAIETLGHSPAEITSVVLTHAHPDHAGGLPALARALDAPVCVHTADAAVVSGEQPQPNPFQHRVLGAI